MITNTNFLNPLSLQPDVQDLRPLIFQTMNYVRSKSKIFKYQRFKLHQAAQRFMNWD